MPVLLQFFLIPHDEWPKKDTNIMWCNTTGGKTDNVLD